MIRGKFRRLVLGGILASFGAVSMVVPAFAGTNGQQVELYEQTNLSSACLSGPNQNGTTVYVCFTAPAPLYNISQFPGYWWKGFVTIENYTPTYIGNSGCTVPTTYNIDYFQCLSL